MIIGRYDVVAGLIAGLVAIPLWFRLEFLKSKKVSIVINLVRLIQNFRIFFIYIMIDNVMTM